jgi:hypothetical protein
MTTGKGDEFTARMLDAIDAMMWTCSRLLPARISIRPNMVARPKGRASQLSRPVGGPRHIDAKQYAFELLRATACHRMPAVATRGGTPSNSRINPMQRSLGALQLCRQGPVLFRNIPEAR